MKKIDVGQTVTILANVGVIGGLAFLILELHQNTDHLRLQLMDQINARQFAQNSAFLAENPAPIIEVALTDPASLTFTDFQVMDAYLLNALGGWEDRYFLYEAGLVDDADWKRKIDEEARWFLGNTFGRLWWQRVARSYFEPEFADYVDQAVTSADDQGPYRSWLEFRESLESQQ